jgi:hypothetical protein
MNKINMIGIIISCIIILNGCATTKFEPFEPDPVKFEVTPEYKVNTTELDNLLKESIEKQYFAKEVIIDENNKIKILDENSNEQPTHILMLPEEYKNVANIVDIAMAYRDTTFAQSDLINTHIATVNSLKELAELERQKVLLYRSAWVDSENMFRDERKLRTRENLANDARFWLVTIGSAVAFAFIL